MLEDSCRKCVKTYRQYFLRKEKNNYYYYYVLSKYPFNYCRLRETSWFLDDLIGHCPLALVAKTCLYKSNKAAKWRINLSGRSGVWHLRQQSGHVPSVSEQRQLLIFSMILRPNFIYLHFFNHSNLAGRLITRVSGAINSEHISALALHRL